MYASFLLRDPSAYPSIRRKRHWDSHGPFLSTCRAMLAEYRKAFQPTNPLTRDDPARVLAARA